MLHLTSQSQIHLAVSPADFRKQIDGLVSLTKQKLSLDPRSGAIFVFINRSHTMIRVLRYQDNGYWIATKRLSQGRFHGWPSTNKPVTPATAKKLSTLLKGLHKDSCQIS
jgi:transposase